MKILAVHNVGFEKDGGKESAVAIWRIWQPLEELKKHVDWQIDYQKTFIKDIEKYKDKSDFTTEEVEAAGKHLGSYDIVFHSYHADAAADALMSAVADKYGTKFVLDDDDNTFAIDPSNPFWVNMTHDHAFVMQQICRTAKYITTTTQNLKDHFTKRTQVDADITVLPNYITDRHKDYLPENGDKLVIGYFGGSAHYDDLHESGALQAIQKLMHEYKHVHFKCVGIPVDYYLPKKRMEIVDVAYGRKWADELFPTLNFDISIAPVLQTVFADGKSNIKWLESTRMGAAFVGSKVGPYKDLPKGTALTVENDSKAWYDALKSLIDDETKRRDMVKTAKAEVNTNWRMEDHWQAYRDLFKRLKK